MSDVQGSSLQVLLNQDDIASFCLQDCTPIENFLMIMGVHYVRAGSMYGLDNSS